MQVRLIAIVFFAADLPAVEQDLARLIFVPLASSVCLELLKVAFGPFELGLVLAVIDLEENVVGLGQVAVFEKNLGHIPRHARGHLNRHDGLGGTRKRYVDR